MSRAAQYAPPFLECVEISSSWPPRCAAPVPFRLVWLCLLAPKAMGWDSQSPWSRHNPPRVLKSVPLGPKVCAYLQRIVLLALRLVK